MLSERSRRALGEALEKKSQRHRPGDTVLDLEALPKLGVDRD